MTNVDNLGVSRSQDVLACIGMPAHILNEGSVCKFVHLTE